MGADSSSYTIRELQDQIPSGLACLTSVIDSQTPADECSSRTRLATNMKPLPSSSQSLVCGSGSSALRAVTLFRKCRMTSRAAGPRDVSSARTLSRSPRKQEALSKDRIPGTSEKGVGRSCGLSNS